MGNVWGWAPARGVPLLIRYVKECQGGVSKKHLR